ncbi:MAG: AAA family ATPase, partial [Chloroflexi bacterium]|nr:AAA family ATPase [Chloroflexota bacterium]
MAGERIQRQIDRLLDEAEEAFVQRDWDTLSNRAQDVLLLDSDNQDARAFLEAGEKALLASSGATSESTDAASTAEPLTSSANDRSLDSVPSSFADGRYVVQRFLGEGGKKKVYLAHDELLDRDVAFALIKTEGLDEVSRARISREAQAMGRLGSHPHIVTVFDLGEVDSSSTPTSRGQADPLGGASIKQPFMVTELMGGGDVEAIVEDAPDHKLPLEQAISIAVETCRGLDFAHSKGIVHRDLKPGNVWLTSDGTAKIGDFGLAVAIDRSRLTQAGMMVGTVSYMPPEQAMGGETTPKADLYSLGAMLYEMVTGRPPFLGDDSVAIIGQHINTPPVAPTWHRSDCPRPLEALIMRLLAKDPNERPESAADVLTALEAIDLTPLESPLTKGGDGTVEEANALDSLAGGVFVGRQAEMGQLKAALEDALSGRGRMVMLVGEPGIGKTRTAQELATYAGLRGCQVLWGRCHESRGAPPYWPWIQVIRSYVREHDPEQISTEMGSGAADIAEIVSDVRERLPGLQPAPKLDDPEQARFRFFDSITAFLKTASSGKPLVIILDNLHWADKPTLLLLEFLAPELANSRLLVIGTYRDADLSRQHPLSETLGELTRERLFERVLLRGLSRQDVNRFIEMVSGITPPRGLVQAVYTQTEGNPLFVTEVVRLLVQEGELTAERAKERDSWDVRIPEGVREVIGRR